MSCSNFNFNMYKNRVCLNCGSSLVVADRSLGGKLVCFKCGSSSFSTKSFRNFKNKKVFLIVIIIGATNYCYLDFLKYSNNHLLLLS